MFPKISGCSGLRQFNMIMLYLSIYSQSHDDFGRIYRRGADVSRTPRRFWACPPLKERESGAAGLQTGSSWRAPTHFGSARLPQARGVLPAYDIGDPPLGAFGQPRRWSLNHAPWQLRRISVDF